MISRIGLSFLYFWAIWVLGCASDAACYSFAGEKCEDYNHRLLICHSEDPGPWGEPYLPNCDVVEYCTDYPTDSDAIETDSSTSIDSDSDIDSGTDSAPPNTVPTGRVCKKVCEGVLLPCDGMGQEQCGKSHHCQWYDDSITI